MPIAHLVSPSLLRALRVLALSMVVATGFVAVAHADELQDVSKLVKANRLDEADKRADAFLKANPKDAQMRFLKGVILSQRGRRDEATAVFIGLTQDYPELPEPYNNLAVIYASQGAYEKARDALETALRVTPDYATAHENLGDVYAAMAARSYEKAHRLDSRNAPAQRKFEAARAVLAAPGAKTAAAPTPTPVAVPDASASQPLRSQVAVGLPSPASSRASVPGVGASAPDIVIPADARSVPSGSNVVAIEQAPARTSDSGSDTSRIALAASSPSDADRAKPVAAVTTAVQQWAASRSVKVDALSIRVDGDVALARFRETNARATVNKALTLVRAGDAWNVTGEKVEP